MANPLVSVIIPTYNRQAVVVNAIESVLSQTYKDIEIIVIDDGSTDDTQEKLTAYKTQLKYIKKTNTGKSHSRNVGLENAKGSIIATLDSDDIWYSDYIEKIVTFLLEKNLDIVFATCELHGFSYERYTKGQYYIFSYDAIRNLVLHTCPAPTSGVIMQRKIIKNGWNNEVWNYDDWHLQVECIVKNKNCKVGYVSEVLWEKIEDDAVKNKLKTTLVNKRRVYATSLLLKKLKGDLTVMEYNIIYQNYVKDNLRLFLVLVKNSESKKEIFKVFSFLLKNPMEIIRIAYSFFIKKII